MRQFTHLHVHTDASKLDGLGAPDRIINQAKNLGFSHLAMTDHGSLANAIVFTDKCKEAGVKPILGVEGYVEVDSKVCHITLLADGNAGFDNLIRLNNIGVMSEHKKPAFTLADLEEHADGLVLLTGCSASPFHVLELPDSIALAKRLKKVFGPRMFAEVMFVSEKPSWETGFKIAEAAGIRPVITNDVHFAFRGDAPTHKVLTQLKASFTYESELLFLCTEDDIVSRLGKRYATHLEPKVREAIRMSYLIGEKISEVRFSDEPTLPVIQDADKQLWDICYSRLLDLGLGKEAVARLKFEMQTIVKMQFASYFLILRDLVDYARTNSIRVGPGRGSGAGSLILYLCGITEVNPLDFNLSFERFLNPQRKGMPDVDVDFESEGRREVIEYASKKWAARPVATYSRYSHKSLVHDLSKFFRIDRDLESCAADGGEDGDCFKKICAEKPEFLDAYSAMLSQIRHVGQHAGGIIIIDESHPVPFERAAREGDLYPVAWTEGDSKELSKAGIVKYDILGLSALSALKMLETKFGFKAPKPEDDSPVFSLFKEGDLSGIFQFAGSAGIRDYTVKFQPRCFHDLVLITSLFRPGALDAGTAQKFFEWREKPRRISPLIDDVLEETAGIIVFQEQVMSIVSRLTGGDLASGDLARRTISKSKPGDPTWETQMSKLMDEFVSGAVAKGIRHAAAVDLWHEIATHSRYSFNKSHSVAYSIVSWEMAWWKYNHQADFYAAMLTIDPENVQVYIFDAVSHGIEVAMPHVNHSSGSYEVVDDVIYMPLSSVKYLGDNGVSEVMSNRPFTSMKDFMTKIKKRAVTGRARVGLFELGAFNGVDGIREDLDISSPPELSEYEKQQAYAGFIIPTKEFIDVIAAQGAKGFKVGIIVDKETRSSKFGEYVVYRMLPVGSYWSRDIKSLAIGDKVKLKVSGKTGKITEAYRM